jgi:hypothetical protein
LALLAAYQSKQNSITVGKLKSLYIAKCSESVQSFAVFQFDETLSALDDKGFIEIASRPADRRLKRVSLRANEMQILRYFKENPIFSQYLLEKKEITT